MPPLTLRQRAYRRIRDKFLSGELVAGMTLSENQLAKELGMSRTPVREAIRQMEMEGLLDYAPRFGAVVCTPDAHELGEMYAVRVFTSTFWRYDREKFAEANGYHKRLLDALRAQDTEAARIATVEAMRVAKKNALEAWDQQERFSPESIHV
jgi:DNA-binding GntR family transcriptional regulator